jgi:uncharacterized protein (TIGR03083 family)
MSAVAARTDRMTTSRFPDPGFATRLELIGERSAALRAAAGAGDFGAQVPGCPDWAVRDLVTHLGEVQRFWAAVVTAGPALRPPDQDPAPGAAPADGLLLEWSHESTGILLDALRAAGPDAECWTWWAESGNAATAGAVARHQVQEAAVHARDAQEAAGGPHPLPPDLAVDAVDEFLHVGFGSMDGWPYAPARVALVADEGASWTLILDGTGASAVRGGAGGTVAGAGATVSGPASDLLLALYRRAPLDGGALRLSGDSELVRQLVEWPPLG